MRETKEQLLKEKAELERNLRGRSLKDIRLREEFGKILGLTRQHPPFYFVKENETLSWEEIFFRVGELNADANYAILLEQKRIVERELHEIKNPKEKE